MFLNDNLVPRSPKSSAAWMILASSPRSVLLTSSATTWALGVHGSAAWRMRIDNASMTVLAVRHGTPSAVRVNVVPL